MINFLQPCHSVRNYSFAWPRAPAYDHCIDSNCNAGHVYNVSEYLGIDDPYSISQDVRLLAPFLPTDTFLGLHHRSLLAPQKVILWTVKKKMVQESLGLLFEPRLSKDFHSGCNLRFCDFLCHCCNLHLGFRSPVLKPSSL